MQVIDIAMSIAVEAYSGLTDKAGKPYILHPLRLMMKFKSQKLMVIALLHDVIEDSGHTWEFLIDSGIPSDWVSVIRLLTKIKGINYLEYINSLKHNKDAVRIKKADIQDNINILRLKALDTVSIERLKKYHQAWLILNKE